MPNRYPDRKRIVRDDEDGPIPSPSINRHDAHQSHIGNTRSGIANGSSGIHQQQQQQGTTNPRAYPQQKPFYFGKTPSPIYQKRNRAINKKINITFN